MEPRIIAPSRQPDDPARRPLAVEGGVRNLTPLPPRSSPGAGSAGEAVLRRPFRRAAAAGLAAILAFGAVRIAFFLPPERALREAAATAAALVVFLAVSGFAARKISLHRSTQSRTGEPAARPAVRGAGHGGARRPEAPTGEEAPPSPRKTAGGIAKRFAPLGPAVPITLLRLGLISLLTGRTAALVWSPEEAGGGDWLPFLLYAPAVLADALDGAVARRAGFATPFGALLDRETDALGLAAGGLYAASTGALPRWYLAAGFARYLAGAALAAESRSGRRRGSLDPSAFRRRLAGFQMGLVAASLAPAATPEWLGPAAIALGVPFLAGFARDYLVMSGRLDPEGSAWRATARALARARRPLSALAAVSAAAGGVLSLTGLAQLGPVAAAAGLFAALTATGSPPPGEAGRTGARGK